MATILCQACNKPNPDTLEICQFCGTPLKNRGTEPLATIRPGEVPVKQQTSELENTLPGWLRDMRKGDDSQDVTPTSAAAQPAKPTTPQKPNDSPLDFLAGLSQIDDEEEAEPDWLASLKGNAPSTPAASQPEASMDVDWMAGLTESSPPASSASSDAQNESPVDWLADLQDDSQPQGAQPDQPVSDWGFNDSADQSGQPEIAASEEAPDWLTALKAQDTNVNAPPSTSEAFSSDTTDTSSGDFPDWLSNLGGESASAPAAPDASSFASDAPSIGGDDDLAGWLSGMTQNSAAPVQPVSEPAPAVYTSAPAGNDADSQMGDFPDWLADLGGETASESPRSQPAPAGSSASQDAPVSEDFPDWLANLGGENLSKPQASQSAPTASVAGQSPSDMDTPDWLSTPTSEAPASPVGETPAGGSSSIFDNLLVDDAIGWLEPSEQEKQKPAPAPDAPLPKQKAFSTGALEELSPLKKTDDVPDWLAGLSATMPKKPSESSGAPDLPGNDAFDWLSGSAPQESKPSIAEPKTTAPSEAAVEHPNVAAEVPATAFLPDSSQNLDSIFSMEMPDWLSGFTPSEPAQPAQPTTGPQQSAVFDKDNLSPAELPSWVQAMRPLESVVPGAQNAADDQVVEQEGPLAGLRSVLPAQGNAVGVRKPKTYSIKLQVDSTQLAQATLLENLIASEAESRPVGVVKRVANIRPLRWVIALVLLLVTLVPGIIGYPFVPRPAFSDASNNETTKFYDLIETGLPDSARVLVVFDYQPGYAGEMEQAAGPVISHLMAKNARMAFVSTLPTGVLMNERMMALVDPEKLYDKDSHYIDLGYLPGDAAGIQVFADTPNMLGNDYQAGNLWTAASGLDQIGGKLSNFDAAIVLTDNPDTGRMWIEQAGAALGTKPMLMVVSAQAAPMIRPYYESNQIKGMVSGLTGGALYEAATDQQSTGKVSHYYWDSYGMGMIAAELLIVVGAIWALVRRLQMRRAEQNQDEDEE